MAIYKLKEIFNTINPKSNIQIIKNSEIPFITISTIKCLKSKLIYCSTSLKYISFNDYKNLKEKYTIPKQNDIFIGRVGTIGNATIINNDINFYPSDNFIWLRNNTKHISKFIYYFLIKNKTQIMSMQSGSTQPLLVKNRLLEFKINLPSIEVQKQIIDIIEPIESIKENVEQIIQIIKNTLIFLYKKSYSDLVLFKDYIQLKTQKRVNENEYFATNAFGELNIDYSKINIINNINAPSRANLKPKDNSIIFSKLDGENKLYYFNKKPNFVISTGFYNITTEYVDYILGFLLNNDFKSQKSLFSTGTTMIGINSNDLSKIQLKKPKNKSNSLAILLSELLNIKKYINKIQYKYIELLIKQ